MTESTIRRLEIQSQYAHLRCPGNCPEGIYVSPLQSAESWNGVIFVRKGYYQGGVFRFEISFPASFPNRAPTVTFAKGSLIHPLVDSRDDRLALASAFPVWKAQSDNMSKLLYFVKGIFKTYNIERLSEGHAINAEMLRIFRTHRSVFQKLAGQCALAASSSSDALFNPSDQTEPIFRKLSEEEMLMTRKALFGDRMR